MKKKTIQAAKRAESKSQAGLLMHSMSDKLPNVFSFKNGRLLCPKCQSEIRWRCPSGRGARGDASCTKSFRAYRVVSASALSDEDVIFCDWTAETVRLADDDVAIIF